MSVSLSKQLAQLTIQSNDSVLLNVPMRQEAFEAAQKSRDPLFLHQFQNQVDSAIIDALKKCKAFEKNMDSQQVSREAYEDALKTTHFSLPVFNAEGNQIILPVPQPSFEWTEKQWKVVARLPSVCMKKMKEIYRKNLIGVLTGHATTRSDFVWDDLKNLAFGTQKIDSSLDPKPVSSFTWNDLSRLCDSCVGLRHVSSEQVAHEEANIKGLTSGSALNISPQMHQYFQTASDKDYLKAFLEALENENPEFLAQFQKGILSFVERSVNMDIAGSGYVEIGVTKKCIFKKVLEKCQFSIIDFGYYIKDERSRPTAKTPTELQGYGQGLGQYYRQLLKPGAAFTRVSSVKAADLNLSLEEWETPIKSGAEFNLLKKHICALYLSNILDTVRWSRSPKEKEGKRL